MFPIWGVSFAGAWSQHAPSRTLSVLWSSMSGVDLLLLSSAGDPPPEQPRVITKRNPTGVRFEIRRSSPYPKKVKGSRPQRDVVGNRLVEPDANGAPRPNNAARRQHRHFLANGAGTLSLDAISRQSEAVAEFLVELRQRQRQASFEQEIQERLLRLLRREGVEPTWLGVGEQTPFEQEFIRKRRVQDLLNDDDHQLELGDGYEGASANVVNIAATFSLGVVDIDTRGILLANEGIEGYFGTRRFPACNVYLMLEQYGKVLSVRMFESGKVSITGAKSRCEALHGAHLFVDYLSRHGIKCHMLDFQIRNVVLVFNVGRRIDIDQMSAEFPKLMPSGDGALMMDASAPYQTTDRREARTFMPRNVDIDSMLLLEDGRSRGERGALVGYEPLAPAAGGTAYERWSSDERDYGLPRPTVVRNDKFSALILRIDPERPPAVLVNPSGTGVLCGASSVEAATTAIQRALRIMMRYTYDGPAPPGQRDADGLDGTVLGEAQTELGVIDMVQQFAASCDEEAGSDGATLDETQEALRKKRLEVECMTSLIETERGVSVFGDLLNELVHFELDVKAASDARNASDDEDDDGVGEF